MPIPGPPVQFSPLNTDPEAESMSMSMSSSSSLPTSSRPPIPPKSFMDDIPFWSMLSDLQRKLAVGGIIAIILLIILFHRSSDNSCPVKPVTASAGNLIQESDYPTHILVTGGAGYIGSHMTLLLYEQDHPYHVVIVDDLSRGDQRNIDSLTSLKREDWSLAFYQHDCGDAVFMADIMKKHKTELVIHFAGYAYASESVIKPLLYFDNIVTKTQGLLQAMQTAKVNRLVYSSSSATYGQPLDEHCDVPISESSPQIPVSPYGRSKLMAEQVIDAYQISQFKASSPQPFSYAALRYFNVIGADEKLRVGPLPKRSLKAFSRVVDACFDAVVTNTEMNIYGDDYDTPDHTAIRDYIHVWDLVQAHLLVIGAVTDNSALAYNVGIGHGFSNKELAAACSEATGHKVKTVYKPRREGDPALVLGDATKIKKELGWKPHYTDLKAAIATAWRWREKVEGKEDL